MFSERRFPNPTQFQEHNSDRKARLQPLVTIPESLPIMDRSSKVNHSLQGDYPEINMSRELFHAARTRDDKSVLVAVNETILKQICRTFFEEGLTAALKQAVKPDNVRRHPLIGAGASYLLQFIEVGHRMQVFFRPHLQIEGVESVATYSKTRDWVKSPIRYISWHPNCFKMAVAANDDSIRIYSDLQHAVPILKNGLQKGITCISWRPWNPSELAVGTQSGTLIWTIETFLQNASVKSQVVQLKHPTHFPVTAVEWNSEGTLLATASIRESDVLLWDIDQNRYEAIRRVGPPSVHLTWIFKSQFLCTSTVGKSFRIWHQFDWINDRWDLKQGRVQSVVSLPDQPRILFCTTEDNFLYSLKLGENYSGQSGRIDAVPIADLSKIKLVHGNNEVVETGGPIQSMVVNKLVNVLAVSFKETDLIAIFNVWNKVDKLCRADKTNLLNITPEALIRGFGDEFPSFITFDERNVLTIGWSSGRVQYQSFANREDPR